SGLADRQEDRASLCRHLPDRRGPVRRPRGRRHTHCRRSLIFPRARARSDSRALRHDGRSTVLAERIWSHSMDTSRMRKQMPVTALTDPKIVLPAIGSAFAKLDPRTLMKNPVIFVLEIVTLLTTVILIRDLFEGGGKLGFEFQIVLWLWFTVLFANFAEAVAEGRGKAQAETLRRQRTETKAKLIVNLKTGLVVPTPSEKLAPGQIVLVEAGDLIPSDGEAIEGVASVNEAAITGESAPVIREAGGDRSAV